MQINELTQQRLRELATLRPDGQRVLSVFLNLDPAGFSTPPARATEISSVLDQAHRTIRDDDALTHEQRKALTVDAARVEEFLRDLAPKGAHGLALFACGPAALFEPIRLARPVETRAVVDDSPFVEPLVELAARGTWMVALVNRQVGRLFQGTAEHLDELPPIADEVHGQHKQGGLSQARYQRSVDEDVADHLRHVAEAAFRRFQRAPFDKLLLGGPAETGAEFEAMLHAYLAERLAGRIDIDVENTNADDVTAAAAEKITEHRHQREEESLERLREAVARGSRGAAGLDDVLEALNERRVETMLIAQGFSAPGCTCPQCGWVGALDGGECPADGTPLDCRDDVIESAVELALVQSAEVLVVRDQDHARELQSLGSVGALLRF
jgi:peptide subunit release factor 1 (eRF1)